MKFSLAFTFHYMTFLSMAILLTPAKFIRFLEKINEIKIEKKQQTPAAMETAAELLHDEIFFRY